MKKLITLSALALLVVAVLCMAQDSTKADKYAFPPLPQELKHADSLLAAGDSTKGLTELRAIVNSKAEDEVKARAHYNIGLFYNNTASKMGSNWRKMVHFDSLSMEEYSAVITNFPASSMKPWAQIRQAIFSEINTKISILKEVRANYPACSVGKEAQIVLGRAYADARDSSSAKSEWQNFIDNYPEDRWSCAEAMFSIAKQTYGVGQVNAFEKVINKYPDQEHWALMSYGGIAYHYRLKGDAEKASEIEIKAVDRYPKHGSAPLRLQNIMYEYQRLGKWEESQTIKQRILREYPESDQAKSFQSQK